MNERVREIAFDTETTGLNPNEGDRIIEIGAVEMINHITTGRTFRRLINPGMAVSEATIRITGITDEHLKDKPPFEDPDVIDSFLEFLGDATIVAHNASFDRGFLNMELKRCGRDIIPEDRWVDTVQIARKRYPGAPASLDALCKRFDISLESRTFHGALLDSQLLAGVYLELLGGRARAFSFEPAIDLNAKRPAAAQRPSPLGSLVTEEERAAHLALIEKLGPNALWKSIQS
ncbi:DNA polymerase III subunit epsilon [Hyphomonas sp. WL0036]|uniref:DNA polymerase III subunit epsilon n=1 Tax=Hyphomonas sediminis TaxID=2866160 RepID=UPI001C81F060|nr:DNA polymerase III subunit epsilon [Hyphomonas sediminis]MBY9065941.1 DNA polymerase III subunit epsilon [Hyphomonas sediminis]